MKKMNYGTIVLAVIGLLMCVGCSQVSFNNPFGERERITTDADTADNTADNAGSQSSSTTTTIKYVIRFDSNGGSSSMEDLTADGGQTVVLPTCTIVPPVGKKFNCWNSKADGSDGASYADGASVKNLADTDGEIVTLYAQWIDMDSHRISYHNTKNAINTNVTSFKESENVILTTVSISGYTFGGWYDVSTDGTIVSGWSAGERTDDVSLWARLTPNSYTVTFNANGGSGDMSSQNLTYDVESVLTDNAFTRTGYTFLGWSDNSGGSDVIYADKHSVVNLTVDNGGTVTLYAVWRANKYTVVYNGNGGVGTMMPQNMEYGVDTVLSDNSYTRTGYTFSGWAISASSGKMYDDRQIVNNLTEYNNAIVALYAVWQPIKYVIRFNPHGGSGSMADMTVDYTDTVTLPSCAFTPLAGMKFGCWNTSIDGTDDVSYADGAAVKNLADIDGTIVTLYAQWIDKDSHRISYHNTKNVANPNETSFKATETIVLQNLNDTGYTFGGWYDASTDGNQVFGWSAGERTDDVSLWARWIPNSYTVRFNANDGSGDMSSQNLTYDTESALTANAFTRTGYTFLGWSDNASAMAAKYDDGGTVVNLTKMNDDEVVLYAIWKANTYNVVFNANGGTGMMANQTIAYNVTTNLNTNAFYRTGYTFQGWAKTSSGTKAYNDAASVSSLTPTSGGTFNLYAVWKANTYTIVFNKNGGTSGTMSNLSMTYDTAKALTNNGFSKTGYTFQGWSENSSAVSATYTNKQSVSNLTAVSGGTVTLYAVWSVNTYTVVFNKNNGTGTMTNQTINYNTETALQMNKFIRTGYTFLGWNTSSSATTAIYTDNQAVTNLTSTNGGTVTMYAIWSANSYTVAFNANCGTGSMSNQNFQYGAAAKALTANAFSRTGYTFLGWSTDPLASTATYTDKQKVSNLTTTSGATVTLYAVWKANTYTVVFNANGGTGTMANQSIEYDSTTTLTANRFAKEHWAFDKWNTSPLGVGTDYTDGANVKNLANSGTITLYAQWNMCINGLSYPKTGMKQVLLSQTSITCDQSGGVFPSARGSVTLGKYAIGKYEVTQQLYTAVMGSNPSYFQSGTALGTGETNYLLRPVESVSWYDAIVFCNKLSTLMGKERCYKLSDGTYPEDFGTIPTSNNTKWDNVTCNWNAYGYRLPTECEWECAARGGAYSTGTPWTYTYSGSNDIGNSTSYYTNSAAWYRTNSFERTWEVGLKPANSLGLHDMSGNVWEWCWDNYNTAAIDSSTPATGPTTNSSSYLNRRYRGGSWYVSYTCCAVSYRSDDYPYYGGRICGFRIVCSGE